METILTMLNKETHDIRISLHIAMSVVTFALPIIHFFSRNSPLYNGVGNWDELTFAKTSGAVSEDRGKE